MCPYGIEREGLDILSCLMVVVEADCILYIDDFCKRRKECIPQAVNKSASGKSSRISCIVLKRLKQYLKGEDVFVIKELHQ